MTLLLVQVPIGPSAITPSSDSPEEDGSKLLLCLLESSSAQRSLAKERGEKGHWRQQQPLSPHVASLRGSKAGLHPRNLWERGPLRACPYRRASWGVRARPDLILTRPLPGGSKACYRLVCFTIPFSILQMQLNCAGISTTDRIQPSPLDSKPFIFS